MANPVTLYVSLHGRDDWSGTLADPRADAADGPLRTVAAARDRLRANRAGAVPIPARVWIRAGVHYLDETLEFTHLDSGTPEDPVVYAAFPGEAVVLSGGCRITGWRPQLHAGQDCWTADLPEVAAGRWYFTQLFVGGQRRPRPRLPKAGWYRFARLPDGAERRVEWMHGPDRVHYQPGQFSARWRHRDDIKVMALQLWFEAHHRLAEVDEERQLVVFRAPSLGSLEDERGEMARFCVENVYEALDTPGEWYLDRAQGQLSYLPLPGEDPDYLEVIAPRLESLLVLRGDSGAPVHDLRFENLGWQHAEWDYPRDDPGSIQAAFKVPGAIVLDRAERCIFYGCQVSHIAQYGFEVRTGSTANAIVACAIHDMGAGGVRIGHEQMAAVEATSPGGTAPEPMRVPIATTVTDCRIHDGATLHPSAIGIWVGNSGRHRIAHNHIFNLNYTGISCGWVWGYGPTATVGNRIEFNHIHHINTERLLSDNGGIYTLGTQPGTVLRGNLIHDIGCYHYGGWGIYPDEGTSEVLIESNLVYATDGAGFSTHYGRDNWVRGNVFAGARRDHINPGKLEGHRTTLFEANIVSWRQGALRPRDWPVTHYLFRDNLLWPHGGAALFGEGVPLAYWQGQGQHLGTQVADPLFADPDGGDFALRRDTPARALGCRALAVDSAGPRDRRGRPESYEDWPFADKAPLQLVRTRFVGLGENRYRVVATNDGDLPASGRLRLQVWPHGHARLRGTPRLAFRDLAPGASVEADFQVVPAPGARLVCVASVPVGTGLHPASLHVEPASVGLFA